MQIHQIITLASAKVRLPCLALVRSLRAVGSDLPVRVIPYAEPDFKLEAGAEWWPDARVQQWLSAERAHPMMRKYQCLLAEGYQFVDTDIVFLRDPAAALAAHAGFVTSCGHWHNPAQTVTAQTRAMLQARSTTWQKTVFNAGQFACDRALFTFEALRETAGSRECIEACLQWPYHEQPGLNLLVQLSGVPISNLTLPPFRMESTWAGDYPGDSAPYWQEADRKPYLLHWAGAKPDGARPVDDLFLGHLTAAERQEWMDQLRASAGRRASLRFKLQDRARRVWRAVCDPDA